MCNFSLQAAICSGVSYGVVFCLISCKMSNFAYESCIPLSGIYCSLCCPWMCLWKARLVTAMSPVIIKQNELSKSQ